jgi:prepilin-type N-terminal cleavage/methylation domain-containing protein
MRRRRKNQAGMTMVELMIALTVLVIGMAGVAVLITSAIASNNSSKLDTGGTLLAQGVLEALASSTSGTITVTDCANNNLPLATTGVTSPGSGANLKTDGTVDWSGQAYAAVPANYKMNYVTCGAQGQTATYEVRTHIITYTATSRVIVVSARQLGAKSGSVSLFAPPVTLRTLASN